MKAEIDVTNQVMQKVKIFEKTRIKKFWMKYKIILIFLFLLTIFSAAMMINVLNSQHAFDAFVLFGEDVEVIGEFLPDTISVFFLEVPFEYIWSIFISLGLILGLIGVTVERRRIISMQEKNLEEKNDQQLSNDDNDVIESKSQSSSNYLILIGIVILVVAGVSFVFMSRQNQSQTTVDYQNQVQTETSESSGLDSDVVSETDADLESQIELTISSPEDNSTVTKSTLEIKGKTVPLADVFVADKELKADKDGNFSVKVMLEEEENYINVTVIDEDGNSSDKELKITYTPVE